MRNIIITILLLVIPVNSVASDIEALTRAINKFNIDSDIKRRFPSDNRWRDKLDKEWDAHDRSLKEQQRRTDDFLSTMSRTAIEEAGRRDDFLKKYYSITNKERKDFLDSLPTDRRVYTVLLVFDSLSEEDKVEEFARFSDRDKKTILNNLENTLLKSRQTYDDCILKSNTYTHASTCTKPVMPQWFRVLAKSM